MGRRGIAVVAALWALLLLGTIAMSFSFAMRTEAQAARNGVDSAAAYYQARTGVNRTIMMFSSMPADNVAQQTITGEDGNAGYKVRVDSESGKIDVNLASEEVIKGVLAAMGLSGEDAESVGDSILDWRDQDDQARPRGAEEADYSHLPEAIRPRNAPLVALDEMRYVRGVSPELYRKVLARVFTVHGRSPQVNVNAAPVAVLLALGLSAEQADAVVARRAEDPFRTPAEVASFMAGQGAPRHVAPRLSTLSSTNAYTITSRGTAGDGVARVVRCTIEPGGGGNKGVRILRWEDLAADGGEER